MPLAGGPEDTVALRGYDWTCVEADRACRVTDKRARPRAVKQKNWEANCVPGHSNPHPHVHGAGTVPLGTADLVLDLGRVCF